MSKRVYFGQNDIRFLYFRYKGSKYYSISIFLLVILVCVVLLFNVVIPQANSYLSIRKEVIAQREGIKSINDNINFMNTMDKQALNTRYQTVAKALPPEKDFEGIISALSNSAAKSGVTIGDFSFSVGEIASKSAKAAQATEKTELIEIVVVVNGNLSRIRSFLSETSKSLPLSEVSTMDVQQTSATVVMKFHYKPYPEIAFREDEPIKPFSSEKAQLVEKLASWQSSQARGDLVVPIGSASGVPLFE